MNRAAGSEPFMTNGRDRHLAESGRLLGGRGGRDRPDDALRPGLPQGGLGGVSAGHVPRLGSESAE
jgi:hypothetical protein